MNRKARSVSGWFSDEAAELFALIDTVQRQEQINGDLFEIGVHHGKSAITLAHTARPDERLGVCDIFGAQDANVSSSGSGDRQIFDATMATHAPGFDRLDVYEKLSSDLSPEEIGGPFRFFHVDGGHLAEEAYGDLELASRVAAPGGVIALDDPFRPDWPGVTEGLLRFLEAHPGWEAFCVGFNKLLLARSEERGPYDRSLGTAAMWQRFSAKQYEIKTLPLAGRPLTIFYVPTSREGGSLERTLRRLKARAARLARLLPRALRRRR